MLDLTSVYPDFVAEVIGVDLRKPITDAITHEMREALDRYAVLVLPDQPLNEEQQMRVAEIYGPLETSLGTYVVTENAPRRLANKELADISNLDESGQVLGELDIRRLVHLSNQLWHTDSSFKKTPASASLLAAQEIPPVGGATEFADMRAAWDALDQTTKEKIEKLITVHDYFYSRSLTGFDLSKVPQEWRDRQPPVKQVLIRKNPRTDRKALYLASHIKCVLGMEEDESKALLDRLIRHATQAEFVYHHRWRVSDLVIWDNRATMHRGTNYGVKHRRAMRRATAQDIGPTVFE